MTDYTRPSARVLIEAAEIQERKGRDYQNAASRIKQADYYPNGIDTIMDIVHAKLLRMRSVSEAMKSGQSPNFESLEDSCIDAINYLSFMVSYIRGDIDGQDLSKDIFNDNGSNLPLKSPKLKPREKITISTPDGYTVGSTEITTGQING